MASIDKAAIAWSIAIVAAGVAIAFAGQSGQNLALNVEAPEPVVRPGTINEPSYAKTAPQTDPFADIADKVKKGEKTVEIKEEVKMDEEPVAPVEEPVAPVEEPVAPVEKSSEPKTVTVEIPTGTSSPGCETSNSCFSPASSIINVGDTVEWKNTDTAAHTVTSGSPADGPSGAFDSSLIMGGASFTHTFDEAGTYDYFCMVHPWMVGNVQVN
jgi:plastocyanin